MVAMSSQRVTSNTNEEVNDRIARQIDGTVTFYSQHPELIPQRLHELDEEWDIERVLETGSSALTLTGLILSIIRGRKWLLLSVAVQSFFMQHAIQGWCPPLPLLRRLGVRTQYEIEKERYAIKSLLGQSVDDKEQSSKAAMSV